MKKLLLLVVIVVAGVAAYGYFFDPALLRKAGLLPAGSKHVVGTSGGAQPLHGISKCVDKQGNVTFVDQSCPNDQSGQSVPVGHADEPTGISHS